MRADWAANRDELMEFWRSGKSEVEVFPDDMVPWLLTQGRTDRLPWAALYLD